MIVTLGAGPTGISAVRWLRDNHGGIATLLESRSALGGLSASYVDASDFTWDIGGHVLFSHFEYFDQMVEKALGGEYFEHMRECWVRILGSWVPYPFQNNIHFLPEDACRFCIDGLKNLSGSPVVARNFKEWMHAVFGDGIVKYFMQPYNFKVWATPPELMSKDWIAERVSVVDLERIERNIAENCMDSAWGPNNLFKFPKKGGTGSIYEAIAAPFKDSIKFNHEMTAIDFGKKELTFSNGHVQQYDKLISTIPIDQLILRSVDAPVAIREAAAALVHNSAIVIGIGVERKLNDSKCWMYFPEDTCPFYRVTNFHNYSPYNVPNGDTERYSALMCEVSYSQYKPINKETIVDETIEGLINTGLLNEEDRGRIVSRYVIDVPYAYPVPTIDRDQMLGVLQPFLEARDVYSRGRFGAWRYEIGNMDHSFMQGVEIVERLVNGKPEQVFNS